MVLKRIGLMVWVVISIGCGPKIVTESASAAPSPAPAPEAMVRDIAHLKGGFSGIAYGPYRAGQAPGGPGPSREQLAEDLRIMAPRWDAIRVYGAGGPTETMLEIIKEESLPLKVFLGAWISNEDMADNHAEVTTSIRLANAYPEIVSVVVVGNETQVDWSSYQVPIGRLMHALSKVRAEVQQPVTTADDYQFWVLEESRPVGEAVDFVFTHAHPLWNGKTVEESMAWTDETLARVAAIHGDKAIIIGETGWATGLNPEGDEVKHIKAEASEQAQVEFMKVFLPWAAQKQQSYFLFEAFDEPWKGSDDPRHVEKHWGVYNEDRTPKAWLQSAGEAP